jgi:2-aminoethylphosphonate-pyruvate transaminase
MEILLNPGPVNLSERVRRALLQPDLCHREIEFSRLQDGIRGKLLEVYGLDPDAWAAVLLTGSGSAALEAMVCSMVPAAARILILENGVYGERLRRIAGIHNISYQALHHTWTEAIDMVALQRALAADISRVVVVQHETTTGRLNDIAKVADICRDRGVPLLLDGVSSFGAEQIQFEDWNIAACAATANKCLHGIPGISFVILKRALLPSNHARRSLYLDLNTYLELQDGGGTPFTQSVQGFYALDEALSEHHDAGGWQARRGAYQERMARVAAGLRQLGIRALLPDGSSSCVLNAFHLPDGMDYQTLHDRLKQRGFIIYAGQGDFARSIFRISLMGAITRKDIDRLLDACTTILSE